MFLGLNMWFKRLVFISMTIFDPILTCGILFCLSHTVRIQILWVILACTVSNFSQYRIFSERTPTMVILHRGGKDMVMDIRARQEHVQRTQQHFSCHCWMDCRTDFYKPDTCQSPDKLHVSKWGHVEGEFQVNCSSGTWINNGRLMAGTWDDTQVVFFINREDSFFGYVCLGFTLDLSGLIFVGIFCEEQDWQYS